MRILGTQAFPIAKISNQHEFSHLVSEQRIAKRAMSIKDLGLMHEVLIRAEDSKLVAGRDRTAAHMLLKLDVVQAKLIECTDLEAELYEVSENLERRHDSAEQSELQVRALNIYAKIEEQRERLPAGAKPGRKKSPMGLARERLAEQRGIKPDSVKKAQFRAKEKSREATIARVDAGKAMRDPRDAGLMTLGIAVSAEFLAQAKVVDSYTSEAGANVRRAMSSITSLRNVEGLPLNNGMLQRLYDDLQDVAAKLKAARPYSLCPHCKGLAGVQDKCAGCVTLGYITVGQKDGVPRELWVEGPTAMVQTQGRILPMSSFIESQAEEVPAEEVPFEDVPAEDVPAEDGTPDSDEWE